MLFSLKERKLLGTSLPFYDTYRYHKLCRFSCSPDGRLVMVHSDTDNVDTSGPVLFFKVVPPSKDDPNHYLNVVGEHNLCEGRNEIHEINFLAKKYGLLWFSMLVSESEYKI